MNCAELIGKFAEYADAAGKPDQAIRVNATRATIAREAPRSGIEIRPKVKGGPLYIGEHIIITREKDKKA